MAPIDELSKAHQDGVVRGLYGIPNTAPVPRLELDELLDRNPDGFNIFLLALERLQDEKENVKNTKMSYYEIAGIHGLPKTYWDGIEPDTNKGKEQRTAGWGYCAHSTPTFPTWHRPYLALYEQSLYYTMNHIVQEFTNPQLKAKYQKAIESFRLPYWDYYKPRYSKETTFNGVAGVDRRTTSFPYDFGLPRILIESDVMVVRPTSNEPKPMRNPLNYFNFPTLKPTIKPEDWKATTSKDGKRKFDTRRTQRFPDEILKLGMNEREEKTNAILNNQRESNVTLILDMIAGDPRNDPYDSFTSFATNAASDGASGNLESLHGSYHVMVGGFGGHMSFVPLAAFDPVFWMHHCQIDRYFAIWQAIHPNSWFDGRYYLDPEHERGKRDALPLAKEKAFPFRHPSDSTGFWSGNLSKKTETFGYVYQDALGNSPQAVRKAFRDKYEWLTRAGRAPTAVPDSTQIPDAMVPVDVSKSPIFTTATTAPVSHMTHTARMGPQVAIEAMEAATNLVAPTSNADLVVENTANAAAVDTKPVAPGETTTQIAFTNLIPDMAAPAQAAVNDSNSSREWYIDQVVQRLALNGTFTVFYFIGAFENDAPENYMFQPTLAGLSANFASSVELCDNCGQSALQRQLVSDTTVITPMLLDYIKIGILLDLSPSNVVPFLISNLKWRVVTVDGQRVDPRQVAGFKIGVSSKVAPLPGVAGPPVFEEYPQIIEQIINDAS